MGLNWKGRISSLSSRQAQSLERKIHRSVEAARQASRLGGVKGSWKRGDEVKMEKVAGWIKVQARICKRGIKEIWRVNTRNSNKIQPYSEDFGVEEETFFPI